MESIMHSLSSDIVEKYDISQYGFLTHVKTSKFPDWMPEHQQILENMSKNEDFREYIDNLDVPDNTHPWGNEFEPDEVKFIYSRLGMIISKYIWCKGSNNSVDTIPNFLGVHYVSAAKQLGLSPVITHGSVDLYNWDFVVKGKDFEYNPTEEEKQKRNCEICLGNLMVCHNMTNTTDEQWFYLVMIAIEHYGFQVINIIFNINIELAKETPSEIMVRYNLTFMDSILKKIKILVTKMYSNCDPKIFFNKLRIFLGGYDKKRFPEGLKIKGSDIVISNYGGGSAAQSSLIQCIDCLLKDKISDQKGSCNFLEKMLEYMPLKHKKFILDLRIEKDSHQTLREFVKKSQNKKLISIYDDSIVSLEKFRMSHYGLVKVYIFKFTGENVKGTGGTNPKEFLTDLINTTKNSRIVKYNYVVVVIISLIVVGFAIIYNKYWQN
jgi:hypothetical protein